jgi:polyhydroxyalkanoate synthesis regulator phasin
MQDLVGETTEMVTTAPERIMKASRGALTMTREEADHLLARGHDLFDELVQRGEKIEQEQTSRINHWLKDWESRGRRQVHVAEEQIEQQVQSVLRALHIPSADDMLQLNKQLDKIGKKLDAYIKTAEQAALPIPNYTGLTAKEVVAMTGDLDEQGLLAVQKFEMAHDGRKTILREIEQKLEAMKA